MAIRDIYLKIEQIPDYSPVAPEPKVVPPKIYGRDCMRNPGHEAGLIPQTEIQARTLTALVYREYLDPKYMIPKPDKIVAADINEPVYYRRVPGAVIYAFPGERLRIHVFNGDSEPHSLHMHGLKYGIDSDGSWPFGTQNADGRRSDEICPGQMWTYTFDVTSDMIGAWPFHDHHRHIAESINRGLFGGVIVLPLKEKPTVPKVGLPKFIEKYLPDLLKEKFRPVLPAGAGIVPLAGGHRMGRVGAHGPAVVPMAELPPHLAGIREGLEEWALIPDVFPIPKPPALLHVPLFFHVMSGPRGTPIFDSGILQPGAQFSSTFSVEGVSNYYCTVHGISMSGVVHVQAGGPGQVSVTISDNQFNPADVTVGVGGTVVWTHAGRNPHTVTENGTQGTPTFCFNGRAFIGNSPTIVAPAGQKIRWYVFNLDVGMMWHNHHPHAQRWKFAQETIDVRSIGPAESFVAETAAPGVLTLPPHIEATQNPPKRPAGAKAYKLRGDFLFHCHVEMHMMQGLAGLVRSHQTVWLTEKQADEVSKETGIPLDSGKNDCPDVDLDHCETLECGKWEEVSGDPAVTFMHAALLPQTPKVLYWGYNRPDHSRLWDASTGVYSMPANQPIDVTPDENIWSAEHTFLNTPEGKLLVHGGFSEKRSFLFNPATLLWAAADDTTDPRFYATTLTLADGRGLTLFGGLSLSKTIEVYDPVGGTWDPPISVPNSFDYQYYPWTHLLPDGKLFIAGPPGVTRRFVWAAPVDDPANTWSTIGGNRSTGGEKGTSVLLPLRPPNYEVRILIAAGNTPTTQQTSELINLSAPNPAWQSLPDLNIPRPEQCNTVLLPDGRVFLAGGVVGAGGPAEILDASNLNAGWLPCADMKYSRQYHSAAILLPDGSVLMGGDPPGGGGPTPHERYFPGYYFKQRPVIGNAPAQTKYGETFTIQTPNALSIAEVVLLRPGAVTHGWNMSQRFVGCAIVGGNATSIQVQAPPDGNIAPPGWYLLFIVDGSRAPSVASWIRVTE